MSLTDAVPAPDGATGWVLWSGTVGMGSDVAERVAAAVAAGYHRISLGPADVARSAAAGVPAADLGRSVRDAGLDIVLDPVMNWYDDRSAASAASPFARFTTDEALRCAEQLGAVAATAIANIGPSRTGTAGAAPDRLVEAFGRLCDRAAGIGVDLALEFVAASEIRTLAESWHVVRSVGRPGAGVVVDTWQFFRGDPDLDLLRGIPGAAVHGVQVSDGAPEVVGSLRDDGNRRLVPGTGCFDLARVLCVLGETGALRWVGPEVIHPDLAALGVAGALARADAPTRDLVRKARAAGRRGTGSR